MQYLDIHTHKLSSRSEVDSRVSYRLVEQITHDGLYSLGLHPCFAEDMTEQALSTLCSRVRVEERVWAIGECGLDKHSEVDLATQIYYFKEQIALSEDLGKPLIIHCVKAYNEVIQLRKLLKPRQQWIMHGFRKNAATAEQLLKAGIFLSFGEYFEPMALQLAHRRGMMYLETDMSLISIAEVYAKASLYIGDAE